MATSSKTSATDVLIKTFLDDVNENEGFVWQRPYTVLMPFNYITLKQYRGFNRLRLPMGEYLTFNQLVQYNKSHNTDYTVSKGCKWREVVYYKSDSAEIPESEVLGIFTIDKIPEGSGFIGMSGGYVYYKQGNTFIKRKTVLQYYRVIERSNCVNSNGEPLPSRIAMGDVGIEYSDAEKVFNSYVERESINVQVQSGVVPCYVPSKDMIILNDIIDSSESKWSTAFHEAGHSTGATDRLNRNKSVTKQGKSNKDNYAREELVAEICAGLCCSECGVYTFSTSESREYQNNIAYVQHWKKFIQDIGSDFIYLASEAEKACEYIMGVNGD